MIFVICNRFNRFEWKGNVPEFIIKKGRRYLRILQSGYCLFQIPVGPLSVNGRKAVTSLEATFRSDGIRNGQGP